MAVTEFTAAVAGSGKSYRRCAHFLATDFLPLRQGRIWTNFPIHIDAMVADVVDNNPEFGAPAIKDRIRIIPDEVLKTWRTHQSGPWEFFKDEDLQGDRIAIDEIHNYVQKTAPPKYVQQWIEFLGEIRHRGCEFECLSQYDGKVHRSIRDEAGLKRDLFNCEQRRDFLFNILMEDWYNLRAKFWTGQYTSSVFEFEYVLIQGKWRIQNTLKFSFEPRFFKLYDSYSTPIAGGKKATGPVRPFQEKSHGQLLVWFFRRNWFNLLWRFVVVVFVIWLCFLGGARICINSFMGFQKSIMENNAQTGAQSATALQSPQSVSSPVANTPTPGAGVPATNHPNAPLSSVADLQTSLHASERRVSDLSEQVTQLKKEKDDLQKQLNKQSDITLLGINYAVTRNGFHLQVGETIPGGIHVGKKVASFDYKRRCVVLDDGSRLPLAK